METVLAATDLCKTVTSKGLEKTILRNVSLDVERGEFLAVMGPSGSGKSTLLYNLSGMDRMTGGRVRFGDIELSDLSENELSALRLTKMGFVFQQSNLLRNLDIFDNIVLSAYLAKRKPRGETNIYATSLMERMGISELSRRGISQVSGGQLQRAAICRALINKPDLIFCDEPTGALDSKAAGEVLDILSELHSGGATVMVATHDVKVAARTERVLYMRDGVICGTLRFECVARPLDGTADREKRLREWLMDMGW